MKHPQELRADTTRHHKDKKKHRPKSWSMERARTIWG